MDMRTTITLEPDVAQKIQQRMRKNGTGLKAAVNEALRIGLLEEEKLAAQPKKPFKVTPFSLQPSKNFNFDKIADVIEEVEGPMYK